MTEAQDNPDCGQCSYVVSARCSGNFRGQGRSLPSPSSTVQITIHPLTLVPPASPTLHSPLTLHVWDPVHFAYSWMYLGLQTSTRESGRSIAKSSLHSSSLSHYPALGRGTSKKQQASGAHASNPPPTLDPEQVAAPEEVSDLI